MIIKRSKSFAGVAEASPGGVTYYPGQVITGYVLDPIDKSIEMLERTPVGDTYAVKRKTGRVKLITRPLKRIFGKKKKEKSQSKKQK